MNEKSKKLLDNENFMQSLKECKTIEEALELCKQQGVNFTEEEMESFVSKLNSISESMKELNEYDLKNIVGGVDWEKLAKVRLHFLNRLIPPVSI